MKLFYPFLTVGLLFVYATSFSQSGQFDVRFNLNSVDCNNFIIFVDIEVRASSPASTFNMSDQNYRFSFNRDVVASISPPITQPPNPNDRSFFVEEELCASGFVQLNNLTSFYNAHTLTGSIDTVVSVNVNLAGGDGYPVAEMNNNPQPPTCTAVSDPTVNVDPWPNGWVHVTRLRVQLFNWDSCVEFTWHTHDPADFPPTFIGEKFAGVLYETQEGLYENFSICPNGTCPQFFPVELVDFEGIERECAVELSWSTATEEQNDYFIIEKSTDGNDFRSIGQIEGNGTTTDPHEYYFMDEDPSIINYYRLIQYDFDGTRHEHETITVRSSCYEDNVLNGISELFPNPVGQDEIISMRFYTNRLDTDALIVITDLLGRKVDQASVSLIQGPNTLQYNPAKLSTGTYFVQVLGDDWYSTPQKFVKVNL